MQKTEKMKNKFIVFEGIDGSGKDTQADLMVDYLKSQNKEVVLGRAPTDNKIGKFIRTLLAEPMNISPERQDAIIGLVMNADRLYQSFNTKDGIEKTLKIANYISVRSFYSAMVYNPEYLNHLNDVLIKPDYVIFVDISPEESLRRISSRGLKKEIYENMEALTKIRKRYLDVFKNYGGNTEIIIIEDYNGVKSPEEIHLEILKRIK